MNKIRKFVKNNNPQKSQDKILNKNNNNHINKYENINSKDNNIVNETSPNNNKKNNKFVNNSDFIKDLIAFSKTKKEKKKLLNRDNNKKEINYSINNNTKNTNQQRREEQNINYNIYYKSNETTPNKKYIKKLNNNKYKINNKNKIEIDVNDFDNNKVFNNDLTNPYNLKTDYMLNNSSNNYHQLENKNIKNRKFDNIIGFTQRNSPDKNRNVNNEQKIIGKNNTFLKINFNKNVKEKPKIEEHSILNLAASRVLESPLFGKIKEPKEGHSKGIIQLIKNTKKSSDYNKLNQDIFNNEDKIEKNKIKYLNDKKMFVKPTNNKYNNNINNNYVHKNEFAQESNNNSINDYKQRMKFNNNNENIMFIYNKTLSYNKYNNNDFSIKKNENSSQPITSDKKNEKNINIIDENKDYINHNNVENNAKNQKLYQKFNTEKLFNLKNYTNIKKHEHNLQKNLSIINRIKKQKHELNLRKNENNNITNIITNSPILINQFKNYRNEFLDDNNLQEEENILKEDLSKLNSNSHLSTDNQNILENTYNFKNSYIKDRYENNINKTNSYFYNYKKSNSKEPKNKVELLKTETNFAKFNKFKRKRFIDFNNMTMNKTNYQGKENSNILYLKPNTSQVKNYKPFYRNQTENKFIMHTNNLGNKQQINNNSKNKLIINNNGYLLSNSSKLISPPKSPNQVYRKPIHKNNYLEISKPPNTINNNFIIYKDEINFINKSKEYNINNENINIELYRKEENFEIKEKVSNKKHKFSYKYYLYHIKKPKIELNLTTKKRMFCQKKIEEITPIKQEISLMCKFTKTNIIKTKIKLFKNNNIKVYNRSLKNIKIKRNDNKIKEIKTQQKPFPIETNKDILFSKQENYFQFQKQNNINNDIIYLLNIITLKNILNIENQITKLIIMSKNALNLQKGESNSMLFINDIINNINTFIDILIRKVVNENKYIELYVKLCCDLYNKYLNSINDLILRKYLNKSNDNNDNNIINHFKKSLNLECVKIFEILLSSNINIEKKQKLSNILNFSYYSFENKLIDNDTIISIINHIFNHYEKSELIDNRYYFIYLIVYYLIKFKEKNLLEKNNFIDKLFYIIKKDIIIDNTPKYLKKTIELFKNTFSNNTPKNCDKKDKSDCYELIKDDITNYISFINQKGNNSISINNSYLEKEYDFKLLKFLKTFELEDIIKEIINFYIESISKKENIIYYKLYIKNIIKPISLKLSLNKLRIFHNKLLLILSDINQLCKKNIYSFEFLGYLIYLLIENELCDIEDMNIFINRDEENMINICKIIENIILSSEDDVNKYYEDFKNIDLFKSNDLFEKYIKIDLNKIV